MEKEKNNKEDETIKNCFEEAKKNAENKKNANSNKNSQENKNKEETEEINKEAEQAENIKETVQKEDFLKLTYQLADMINKYKQLDGEFDNYRKRTREEIKKSKTDGMVEAVKALFPAIDSFKKAKSIIKDKSCLDGINMIEKSILETLSKMGVKKIDCVGKPFDMEKHNAIMTVEDKTKESGTVVEEVESGFTFGEEVIKFSKVIVCK